MHSPPLLPRRQRNLAPQVILCVARLVGVLGVVGVLGLLGAAPGARAATVLPPVDLLQLDGVQAAPAAGALERALTIDTNTSQGNLELLLEARRAGDTASRVRGSGGPPDQRSTLPVLPVAQPRGTLVPLGLQSQDSVTAPGAAERREWLVGTPTNTRSGLPGSNAGTYSIGHDTAPARQAGPGADDAEFSRTRQLLGDVLQFLRDHRFLLLGGAGLLVLAAAGLQAVTRRA